MVFNSVPEDERVWIKGQDFTLKELIGKGYDSTFKDGAMAIVRLAPQVQNFI